MSALPKVSVSITAYNHERFIRQAIDGVLMQKTDFPVEILLGEDASTDATRKIVEEYAERYPAQIRAFYHIAASKLRIKGRLTGRNNLAHNLNSARGEYIALLDGDDYWTDEHKLARQVAQLDADASLASTFHPVQTVDGAGLPMERQTTIHTVKPRYTLLEMIDGVYEAPTCSVVFRRSAIRPLPAWFFETPVGDFAIHVLTGQCGDFGFIDQPMGAYRIHAGGIWSQDNPDFKKVTASPAEVNRRDLGRFEMMVDLLRIVAANTQPPHRAAALRRMALYAGFSVKLAGQLDDKPALRRNLAALWRTRQLPPRLRWRTLARLVRQAL